MVKYLQIIGGFALLCVGALAILCFIGVAGAAVVDVFYQTRFCR